MYTLCWSPKGGSGTTSIAAALALLASRERSTVLVDLDGDAPAALGVGGAGEPGVVDWLGAPHADGDALFRLATPCFDDIGIIGRGKSLGGDVRLSDADWARLGTAIDERDDLDVVVDAGPHIPPSVAVGRRVRSLMILRPCYLSIRRAVQCSETATGVVLVIEPSRGLRRVDVERALSLPVLAEVPWDPTVARAVDAGLLASRLPVTLSRGLRRLTTAAAA